MLVNGVDMALSYSRDLSDDDGVHFFLPFAASSFELFPLSSWGKVTMQHMHQLVSQRSLKRGL